MFDNVNLSKFRVPTKQKGFLHRARLIDWMHENIHRKLTFISAPAGYGKTSLLVDFASDVEVRICWCLVTQGDEDLRKFAWDLLLSIRQSFPNFGSEIESYLKTNPGGIDHVSLANDFINEALNHIDDYCLLFVDDYHLVAESDEVTGFFELLLDYLPDGIRLVVASRTEFGIPTGKLYARNEINLMNVDMLRFRTTELQQLITRSYRIKLTDEEAEELAKRSDGWIVAVMLAANSLKWGRSLEFQGTTDYVYSFLAQDVIERESEQLQQFMLAMAIVDEFNFDIARALFKEGPAEKLIQELEWRNLFVSRVETQEGPAYRFHQLFLEFLRHRLEASNISRQRELHSRAAEYFDEVNDWDKAIYHFLQIDDRLSAARLMDYVAKHHYVFGANVRVETWLDILSGPPDYRSRAPELLLNRAKFLVDQDRLSEAEELLEIADQVFESSGDQDKVLNSLGVRSFIFWQRGELDKAQEMINTARELISRSNKDTIYPGRAQQFDRMEGFCEFSKGNFEAGVHKLNQTIRSLHQILNEVENRITKIQIVHDLVQIYEPLGLFAYQKGKIYDSQTSFLEAFHLREKYLRNNQGLLSSLNNIGYIYYQLGDLEKAFRYLTLGLQILDTTEKGQASIYIYNSYADLMRDLDEWDEAEKNLKAAIRIWEDSIAKKKELDIGGSYQSYMALERVRGNYDKAIHYLHETYRQRSASPDTPEFHAHLGSIYFSMGQIDLAIQTLTRADEKFDADQRVSQAHATVDYLLGCGYFKKDQKDIAKSYLMKAFAQTAEMGYDHFLISEGRRTLPVLTFASEAMPELTQVRSILKRVTGYQTGRSQIESAEEVETESQDVILLEVIGFGEGRIRLNGDVIHKSDWRANMARSLFYFILDRNGESSNTIKVEFWPDKSGAKATSNFQSTLWRARKALQGLNILVLENNRYVISNDVKIWYDVKEFETLIEQANVNNVSDSERINLLKSAVELVEGDYLQDVYMEWAHDRRIQLQRLYQETLEKLGNMTYARERFDEASHYFEQLMRADPYRDDIQISILKCLSRSGSVAQAASRYKAYAKFLEKEGLQPSEELESYYLSLTGPGE